ncbi:MAG TPA: pilus assembly protein PilM, partial [bacterium]|nr:pilus assembly protein PilM [bacterium]
MGLFGRKKQILALDIGSHAIKYALLQNVGKEGIKVLMAGRKSVPPQEPGAAETESQTVALKALVAELDLVKKKLHQVVFALPSSLAIVRFVKLPPTPADRVRAILRSEAEQHIPFSIDDVAMDIQIVRSDDKGVEAIICAIKQEKVDDYVNMVTVAGLNPEVIDISAFALFNIFRFTEGEKLQALAAPLEGGSTPEEPTVALLDMGATTTDISVCQANRLMLTRSVAISGNSLTEAVSRRLNCSPLMAERYKRQQAKARLESTEVKQEEKKGLLAMGGPGGPGVPQAPAAPKLSLGGPKAPDAAVKAPGLPAPAAPAAPKAPTIPPGPAQAENAAAPSVPPPAPAVPAAPKAPAGLPMPAAPAAPKAPAGLPMPAAPAAPKAPAGLPMPAAPAAPKAPAGLPMPAAPAAPKAPAGLPMPAAPTTPQAPAGLPMPAAPAAPQAPAGLPMPAAPAAPKAPAGLPMPAAPAAPKAPAAPTAPAAPAAPAAPPTPPAGGFRLGGPKPPAPAAPAAPAGMSKMLGSKLAGDTATTGGASGLRIAKPKSAEPDDSTPPTGGNSVGAAKAEEKAGSGEKPKAADDATAPLEDKREEIESAIKPMLDRLVGELKRSFDYYKAQISNEDIKKIYLCGGGAMLKDLAPFLQQKTGIETEVFNPLAKLEVEGVDLGVEAGAVFGLGLRVVDHTCAVAINLLPADIAIRKRSLAKQRNISIMSVLGALLAVEIAFAGYWVYSMRADELASIDQ